jgi:hypothetical protein
MSPNFLSLPVSNKDWILAQLKNSALSIYFIPLAGK